MTMVNLGVRFSGATRINVAASDSAVELIPANTSRLGAVIVNDSSATLYIKFGTTVTSSNFTYLLAPGYTWELPSMPVYTGTIYGIWSSATGNARCTEMTF